MATSPQLRLALKVVAAELGFMLIAFALFFFSFLFFFADHQPYPGPFGNVRFLVGFELVVSLAVNLIALRVIRRGLARWPVSPRVAHWLHGFNITFVVVTLFPLLLIVIRGD